MLIWTKRWEMWQHILLEWHCVVLQIFINILIIQRVDFTFIIQMLQKNNGNNVANEEDMTHITTSSFTSGISSDTLLSTKIHYGKLRGYLSLQKT